MVPTFFLCYAGTHVFLHAGSLTHCFSEDKCNSCAMPAITNVQHLASLSTQASPHSCLYFPK